jgi:hypothetical protein
VLRAEKRFKCSALMLLAVVYGPAVLMLRLSRVAVIYSKISF